MCYESISPNEPKRPLWSIRNTASVGLSPVGEQFKAGLDHPRRGINPGELPTTLQQGLLFQQGLGKLEVVR